MTYVALRSHEAEGSGSMGGDPFRGFPDGLRAFDSHGANGEVVRDCERVATVSSSGPLARAR